MKFTIAPRDLERLILEGRVMDKSAIKKFAIEARTRLIEQVEQKAFEIGVD